MAVISEQFFLKIFPIVGMFILIVAGIIGFKLRKNFQFNKYVERTEGEVKTRLYLNYSLFADKELKDIVIKDFVPKTLKAENFDPEPKVEETENGKQLEWRINDIQPGKDLELEYNLKPDFDNETKITLPGAELEVEQKKVGQTKKTETRFKPGN